MKKIIAIILTLVLMLSALSVSAFANASTNNAGYSADRVVAVDLTDVPNILDYMYVESAVFKITGASGMEYLSTLAGYGENYKGITLYLANDIDMTGSKYTPLEFYGTLDGQGHIIDNLVVGADVTPTGGGLFISLRDAVIKNVIIGENCSMISTANDSAGFIAKDMNGNSALIDNVYVAAEVTGQKPVGGLVGVCNGGTITNSTFAGKVLAQHNDGAAGGMTGLAYNDNFKVVNCRNVGSIEATGYNESAAVAGGMVGRTWSSLSFEGCINNGTVTSKCAAGGILGVGGMGEGKSLVVRNCTNYGSLVSGNGKQGVIGDQNMSFTNENNTDSMGATDNTYIPLTITPNFPEVDPYVPYEPDDSGDSTEDIFGGGDNNGDDTLNETEMPENTTTESNATVDSETTDEKSGGCGSTIGAAMGVLVCAGLAVAVGKKKKD